MGRVGTAAMCANRSNLLPSKPTVAALHRIQSFTSLPEVYNSRFSTTMAHMKEGARSAVFLVLLIFIAAGNGIVKMADARLCESQSHKFVGTCVRESNCANVCVGEGFQGGVCRGVSRKCFCTKPC